LHYASKIGKEVVTYAEKELRRKGVKIFVTLFVIGSDPRPPRERPLTGQVTLNPYNKRIDKVNKDIYYRIRIDKNNP